MNIFTNYTKRLSGKTRNLIFNYKDYTLISGCPTTTQFTEIFGENWKDYKAEYTRERDGKKSFINYGTVWNVLFSFDDDKKIKEFAQKRLGFDDEKAGKLVKINLKQGYANLSLCAIRKIIPYLEEGLLYTYSAYFANLDKVLKDKSQSIKDKIKNDIVMIIDGYNDVKKSIAVANELIGIKIKSPSVSIIDENIRKAIEKKFGEDYKNLSEDKKEEIFKKTSSLLKKEINKKEPKFIKNPDMDEIIKNRLIMDYDISWQYLEKLYHPSDIDIYPKAKTSDSKDGKKYLCSPRTPSVRNPMAMKALHQLKYMINTLIKEDKVSFDDTVNIELARELNDANMRAAIKRYQNENQKKREEYAKEIVKLKYEPNNNNILKYQLWEEQLEKDVLKYQLREEQKHICLYTGNQINIHDFLGTEPKFDIEYTIPRSQSFDDSQENLTLCDLNFNRNIKRNKITQTLTNIDEILPRIEHWAKKIDDLNKNINKEKNASKLSRVKGKKDIHIQNKHYYILKRNYLKSKYDRFIMSSVPEGFSNRQLVDTMIITKYARAYLKTVFQRVFTVKGSMTAAFRKLWGLQDEFSKKERISHVHHTIDAIVIASINRAYYNLLSQYYRDEESLGYKPKHAFKKPWKKFTEDVKKYEDEI